MPQTLVAVKIDPIFVFGVGLRSRTYAVVRLPAEIGLFGFVKVGQLPTQFPLACRGCSPFFDVGKDQERTILKVTHGQRFRDLDGRGFFNFPKSPRLRFKKNFQN